MTDQAQGTAKEALGKLKVMTGKVTRNPDLQDRGAIEKMEGTAQKKVGDIKRVFNK